MTFGKHRLGSLALGAAFLAAACAGSKLHDVGDIDGGSTAAGGDVGDDPVLSSAGKKAVVANPTAGAGGSGFVPLGDGGVPPDFPVGGAAPVFVEGLECEDCQLVAEGTDIRDVATTKDRVYWVEYDTQDNLGNYEDNGRLLSILQDGGEPSVIASDLQGPIGLGIGDDYAYVVVDHSSEPNGETELLRVPLDGGEAEVIGALDSDLGSLTNGDFVYDWFQRNFVMNAGTAYWVTFNTIMRLPEDGSGPLEMLFNQRAGIHTITGDESSLYFIDDEGLKAFPYAGGDPTLLRPFSSPTFAPAYSQLTISGDYFYALDNVEPYLVRMPKTGGAWKRVAKSAATHLRFDGSNYFTDPPAVSHGQLVGASLLQSNLTDPSLATILAKSPPWDGRHDFGAWDVASAWVYFGWESRLYRAPRVD